MDIEQFLNDIRENCLISSLNDNECMWNAIQSKAYQTNISYQEFATDVLPFLEGTGLYYEDLINANVDAKGCLASGDFGGCVVIALTDAMQTCGEYDFIGCYNLVDSPNGICPESFKFQSTGANSYTCDLAKVSFKYLMGLNKTFYIGDLCIQVPNKNFDGQNISATVAADLMSQAYDDAQDLTATYYAAAGHVWTHDFYKQSFINNLKTTMIFYFSGTFGQGTMNVSNTKCLGNFLTGFPKYSIFC